MKLKVLFTTIAAASVLAGCASFGDNTPPLTIDALVTRAKAGESNESLLAALRASRERFVLTGSDFAKLKERGLPDVILDELQQRQIMEARDDEWRRTNPIWWRPWPYYWYDRPVIIVHPTPKPKNP